MDIGVFAKDYQRSSVDAVLAACAANGFPIAQFNTISAGLEPMPDAIPADVVEHIRTASRTAGVQIVSFSATFNMIHPDPAVRQTGLRRLAVLAAAANELGVPVLSLCTGSRDPDNMWHHHPDNLLPDAWSDLLVTMRSAVAIAEQFDVYLGVEPEPGNVVRTSAHADRLLAELETDRIGIVLDPANLLGDDLSPDAVIEAIDTGLELLADRTIVAHGKDRFADGTVAAPGQGIVPWGRFMAGLDAVGFAGPFILHGFPIEQAPAAAAYVRSQMPA